MYHVAICDDDKRFVSFMKRMLFQAKGEDATNLNVYEFNSGEELIMTLDETLQFDLLILDMQLGGMEMRLQDNLENNFQILFLCFVPEYVNLLLSPLKLRHSDI